MKYISVDIETTGLDSENCQILSFGAIIEDTNNKLPLKDIPKFHAILLHKRIEGEPFALNINKDLIGLINQYQISDEVTREALEEVEGEFLLPHNLAHKFKSFLIENGFEVIKDKVKITVAGKNFATFDKLFIEKLEDWKAEFRINQRIIDPTILFTDWQNDVELPNLGTCKQRAGFKNEVAHTAVEDAWDIIQLLRTQY